MHFLKIGDYLAVSRITGPKHNLLLLRLSNLSSKKLDVQCLPPSGGCVHDPLDAEAIAEAVHEGVADANKELNTDYAVSGIKYVQNDTKPEIVYGYMTLSLLRHLHAGGTFAEAPPNKLESAQ